MVKLYIPFEDIEKQVKEKVEEKYKNHEFTVVNVDVDKNSKEINIDVVVSENFDCVDNLKYNISSTFKL